jgi:hypothetical protein
MMRPPSTGSHVVRPCGRAEAVFESHAARDGYVTTRRVPRTPSTRTHFGNTTLPITEIARVLAGTSAVTTRDAVS